MDVLRAPSAMIEAALNMVIDLSTRIFSALAVSIVFALQSMAGH